MSFSAFSEVPLSRLALIRYGLGQPPEERVGGVPFIRATDISHGKICLDTAKTVDPEQVPKSRDAFVGPGDILVVRSGAYTGDSARIPASIERAVAGYDMVVTPRGIDSHYLGWALLAPETTRAQVDLLKARAAQPHLNAEELGRVVVPLPRPSTQRAIASFLDRETKKIDSLIEKKRRLLDLLEEKRATLITWLVTRGLDPDVPMKDSGIDWLGGIPKHWEVVPLKRLWRRADYGISDSGREGGKYSVLTMGNIDAGTVTVPTDRGVDEVDAQLLLQPGDLLFNRTNSRDLVGKVGLYEGDDEAVTFASYLVRLRPRSSVSSRFLNYLLNSPPILAEARARSLLSVNQANLNPTRYGEISVPCPPLMEQEEIASHIDSKSEKIVELQDRVTIALSLLREYRTALISGAVTGKIDVRDKVPA